MREDESTYPFWIDETAVGAPGRWRLGLAEDFFETLAGDLVGVELAPAGTRLRRGDTFGFAHTGTRTVDLRAPFDLTIESVNPDALADARLVQASPYHRGWLAEITRPG